MRTLLPTGRRGRFGHTWTSAIGFGEKVIELFEIRPLWEDDTREIENVAIKGT